MALLHILKKTLDGQSVTRIFMNLGFRGVPISGNILDVGGARNPDYFSYLTKAPGSTVDVIDGQLNPIDFERDLLPHGSSTKDTVLLCNVLEHIFNHEFLLSEVYRVLKSGSQVVGFVPFLINYHPDPHDYFRYTNETLEILFTKAGFSQVEIRPIGKGPFLVHCNNLIQSLPTLIRPVWFLWCYTLDALFLYFRPGATKRFPLGYIFIATK